MTTEVNQASLLPDDPGAAEPESSMLIKRGMAAWSERIARAALDSLPGSAPAAAIETAVRRPSTGSEPED